MAVVVPDFGPNWLAMTPKHYAHAAWQVMELIKSDLGARLERVIVTTDETDEEWLYVSFPLSSIESVSGPA